MKPSGILLAAGSGSRFGGDKLLHPLPDGTPIGVAAARNIRTALPHVVAVVRPDDHALAGLLEREGCQVVVCENAACGMGFSLATGVEASRAAGGWVIALADMPRIRPDTIARVAAQLVAGASIVAPVYDGKRGHPVGFGSKFVQELTQLAGDSGARELLQRYADEVDLIECDDPWVLYDIDRQSDLANRA